MRVQVRKCPFTGKLFEESDLQQYAEHLEVIRAQNRKKTMQRLTVNRFQRWLVMEKARITTPEMIPAWLIANQITIMEYVNACRLHGDRKFEIDTDKLVSFNFETIKWKTNISNTHNCPHDGVQNFRCNPCIPMSYPGWKGNFLGSLIRLPKNNGTYPYNEIYHAVGLKTESGGGGNKHHTYDFIIFLADWPGLLPLHQANEHKVIVDTRRAARILAVKTARYAQEKVIHRLKYGVQAY